MSNNGRVFRGGVPIRPDVERLMKATGELRPGDLVPHSTIETAIGAARRSNRYNGVVASWRKRLFREKAIKLAPEGDDGFRVLTQEEANSVYINGIDKINRASYRVAVGFDSIDTTQLSEQGKQKHQIGRRHAYLLTDMARTARREIGNAAPSAVSALPRLVKRG